MADWEYIGTATARNECHTIDDDLTVFVDVKIIGGFPMYRARIVDNDSINIVKYPLENSRVYSSGYNAQFTYRNNTYLLNVPYWR